MDKVDFHTHSNSSDGIMSPKEVVQRAFENNVRYLALTDHDTISGLCEAKVNCYNLGINFIPGIELSTTYNKESIHILGFFKDNSYENKDFIEYLKTLNNGRKIRAEKIIEKLKTIYNIDISLENVLKRGKDVVARPHIAQEIVDCGYPYDVEYIFQNFIGKDCPAFVPTTKLTTPDGVSLLQKYNALVFLAHPKLIKNTPIEEFLHMNFDGIESIYFQNTKEEEEYYISLANNNNLLISAGSDCHGDVIGDLRHGDIGYMNLPIEYLEKFLNKYK